MCDHMWSDLCKYKKIHFCTQIPNYVDFSQLDFTDVSVVNVTVGVCVCEGETERGKPGGALQFSFYYEIRFYWFT